MAIESNNSILALLQTLAPYPASVLLTNPNGQNNTLLLPDNTPSPAPKLSEKVETLLVRHDPGLIDILLPGSAVSAVALLPIATGGKTIGALNIGLEEKTPTETTWQRWQDKARLIGKCLASPPDAAKERRRNTQLNLIRYLGRQAIAALPLDEFFDLAVVAIREKLEYYNVSLFMLNPSGDQLVLTAHAGAYRDRVFKGASQPIERGLMGWVVRHTTMRLANDVRLDPYYIAFEDLDTRSEICLPVGVSGAIEGVLNVESDQLNAFDEVDIVALEALANQIADLIQSQRQIQAFEHLQSKVATQQQTGQLLGHSPAIAKVLNLIDSVAQSEISVLIRGETGTGKELVAEAIHRQSHRHDHPFVALNCAALPENLFESELFGYEPGAFTGATRQHRGKLEQADGGTLLLDEVAEIPLAMQAKLLRAVEQQRFTRLGGNREVAVNVRILSATNQPLEAADFQERFRRDLYFRLNGVEIHLPPLRQRGEDISLLAAHFLQKACAETGRKIHTIPADVLATLQAYSWPGNIRELENAISRAVLLEPGDQLTKIDLGQGIQAPEPNLDFLPKKAEEMSYQEVCTEVMEGIEREYFRRLLTRNKGNISRTASQAGINRRTLYNKLAKYGMSRVDFVPSR